MGIAIVNGTALALGFIPGPVRGVGHQLTTIVKGAFRLVPSESAVAAEKPLFAGDVHVDDEPVATCTYGTDFAPFKPKADVVATGTCHLPRGVTQGVARATLRVGPMKKSIAVYGDRHFVEQKLGGFAISEPKPFRSFPLRYEYAFGGPGFASNPVGKGFGDVSTPAGRALPNIEDPRCLVKTPGDRVEPAGFAPLNRRWGHRTAKLGTYDDDWLVERWPDFPDDFDWTYFNAAPADQQVDYLGGDEPIVVEGMHPDVARYETRLPGVRPRCFLRKTGGAETPPIEVVLHLDTVAIDMDAETMVLVWRGLVPVRARDYAEVERALLVAESLYDAPAPAADYHADVYWRPAGPPLDQVAGADEAAARGDVPPAQARAAAEVVSEEEVAQVAEARADLEKAGADPALLARLKGVTRLAVMGAILTAYLDENLPEEARKEVAAKPEAPNEPPPLTPEAKRKEKAKRQKEELDAMRAELAAKGARPELLEKLAAVTTQSAFLAILMEDLPPADVPDDAKQRADLVAAVAASEEQERRSDLADEASARAKRGDRLTREEVLAMLAANASFAAANLTELDLSGLDFSKVNLSGAVLVGAKLEKTHFAGADLTGATLRLADLRGAVLDDAVATGADLEGAQLAGATASRAIFQQARLGNASLEGAKLDEADFTGASLGCANLAKANLAGAIFHGATLERASLRGASGTKASFRSARLASADLVAAKLDASFFIGAVLDGADAARVSLRRAHLDECTGKQASFAEATLTGLRAQDASLPRARFTKVSAEGARFAGSDLGGADFSAAHLVEADFSGASLVDATFHLARLEQVNFTKAKLVGARLTQANLFRGRLGGADLTAADCRSSNLFECELFEADTTRTRFDRANLKRTCLDRGSR